MRVTVDTGLKMLLEAHESVLLSDRKGDNFMSELDEVIKMLDDMAQGEVSRMKIEISEEVPEGEIKKAYHHGRCDVGSPFATGKLYDLEEENSQETLEK